MSEYTMNVALTLKLYKSLKGLLVPFIAGSITTSIKAI